MKAFEKNLRFILFTTFQKPSKPQNLYQICIVKEK